jgi:predicted lipoprotein with Yx(FWY)xxD motif
MKARRISWFAVATIAIVALAACNKAGASSGGGLNTKSISGVGTVLVDAQGLTLYDLPSEANGHITCTGSCEQAWPPLLEVGGKLPSAPSAVSSKLGTAMRPDGSVQVTYNGLPLYTFAGESAGQASGQGVGGFVAVTVAGGSSGNTGGGY